MENNDKEVKGKTTKKEIIMIIVAVVLAFGLTVAGIVYLTNFLLGGNVFTSTATQDDTDNDSMVRFSIDNNTDDINDDPEPSADQPVTVAPPPVEPPVQPAPLPTPKPQTSTPAPKPSAQPAPAQQTQKTSKDDIPSVSPSKGKYQIQLFALKDENKAKSEAKKYKTQYPDIFVMRANLGAQGVWFRARCCSAETKEEAEEIKSAMEQKFKSLKPNVVKAE
ncbi:MAG: SPOR domain-containing protein [Deferribacteraceae bacterium]|jgi:cell division septation protein DedD|nr:SPOR domain-containing protein [Deferribacteraceae bacterium]